MTTTKNPTAPSDTDVSPEPILRIAGGFMASKHLFAASDLGIFEALGQGPTDLAGLAARTGLTRRAARISVDAVVALGLVEREDDTYRNTPVAEAYLAGGTVLDMRPLLRFWDRISFPAWIHLATALATETPREIYDIDEELKPIMSAGIEAFQAGPSMTLPQVLDLSGARRLLDVGGGTGSWSVGIVRHHASLTATVLELPDIAPIARERIAEAGLQDRIDVAAGDATEAIPGGYDAFLLANVVHYWSPQGNVATLRSIRAATEPGALVALIDFWTDRTHTEPFEAAMMAGEFAAHLKEGNVYSVDEAAAWLSETGWRLTEHRALTGPMSVVVAQAV